MKHALTLSICSAAAALALGLCACSQPAGQPAGDTSAGADSSPAAAAQPAATSADTSAAATAPAQPAATSADVPAPVSSTVDTSPAATAGDTSSGFDFVDECIDEHGNISLYALTELKGWQVATLLDQQQYEWDETSSTWTRPYDGASFSALKQTGPYTLDTYNEMNEKGGAIVAVGFQVVAGYKDPQAALSGNAQCVIEDSWFDENGNGIAIFYGPSMTEYLAIISPYTESTTLFEIFSQGAVGSGMADELLSAETGGSFQAMWKMVTGEDHYGA